MSKFVPPEYGVELVEGVPGSGKSLYLVRRMIEVLIETRRPVYTNLPLVWRACRWYLKRNGGEKLASMLFELKRDHFFGFCARQTVKAQFLDDLRRFRVQGGKRPLSAERLQAAWEAAHGKDVTSGDGANWIPSGSVVIIDEAHHWCPQRGPGQEDPNLVSYITKHRHHFHWLWLATQNRMQVSVSIRRNLSKLWEVRNMGEDKLAWGIRFKHLGVRAIGYAAYTGDQVEAKVADVATPIENYVLFPTMPWNQIWFRLYRSFTHVASPAQMRRQMEAARIECGLTASGEEVQDMTKRTHSFVALMLYRAMIGAGVAAAALVVGSAGYGLAVWNRPAQAAAVVQAEKPKPVEWGALKSISKDGARVDGGRVQVGGRLSNGAKLEYVSLRPRAAVLTLGDDLWVWEFGQARPKLVGRTAEVYNLVNATDFGGRSAGVGGSAAD